MRFRREHISKPLSNQKGSLLIEIIIAVVITAIGSLALYTMFIDGQRMLLAEEHRIIATNRMLSAIDSVKAEFEMNRSKPPLDQYKEVFLIERDPWNPEAEIYGLLYIDMEESPGASGNFNSAYSIYSYVSWVEPSGQEQFEEVLTQIIISGQ